MLYALKILTKKLIKQPQNLKSKHILIKVTNRKLINIHSNKSYPLPKRFLATM